MRLTLRVLGLDVIDLEIFTDPAAEQGEDEGCDLSGGTLFSTPVGFTPSYGDQAWEQGLDR